MNICITCPACHKELQIANVHLCGDGSMEEKLAGAEQVFLHIHRQTDKCIGPKRPSTEASVADWKKTS